MTPIVVNGGVLDGGDQAGQVQLPAILPGVVEQARDEYVLAARDRVGVDAEQRQDARGRRLHPLAVQVDVVHQRGLGAANDLSTEIGTPALLPGV